MSKKKITAKRFGFSLGGYTIIELLIVVMVMVMVFGLGVIRYRDFQRRQALSAAARTLITDLRFAQERALAGNKPATCTTLSGYVLHRVSASSYDIRVRCLPGPTDSVTKSETEVGFASKHPGITLSVFSDVFFKVLGEGVGSAVSITLTQANTSFTKVVNITTGGEIQ